MAKYQAYAANPALRESYEAKIDVVWKEVLDFTDRESYLAWVAAWKSAYAEMTLLARQHKLKVREWHAERMERAKIVSLVERMKIPVKWYPQPHYYPLHRTLMLRFRAEGKALSWRMRCQRFDKEAKVGTQNSSEHGTV